MWETRNIVEDETSCGPLCQHPACWSSNNRKVKGIPRTAPRVPSPDSIETDLPTLKVYDMLGDYGQDNRDLYPSKYQGKAAHHRKTSAVIMKEDMTKSTSGFKLKAPAGTPRSMDTKEMVNTAPRKQTKVVEVQEFFDVDDLNNTWDKTFLPKQCMVWVPNPNYKRKISKDEMASINQLSQGPKPKILLKNLTGDLLPSELDYDQMSFTRMNSLYSFIGDRRRSPPPSSRRTYSRGVTWTSQGRRPQFIFDMAGLDELLDLPREILVEVLDNAQPSDFTSKETMHALIEKVYPGFNRGITNLSSGSVELLQQTKMNIHEGRSRNIKNAHLIETKPVFHLDEDGVEQPRHIVDALSERSHQPLDSEYVESIRDLYIHRRREYNQRKPLPPIGEGQLVATQKRKGKSQKKKLASISLGLPELPSGVRHTRTFTYNKTNYRNVDLTIAPVPTPPTSVRETESNGSDHGTTMRVNIPSGLSEGEPVEEDHGSTDTPHSSRSGRDAAPMHRISPTLSTKVPLAPATTPATHATPTGLSRDTTLRSQGQTRPTQEMTRELSSPTQNIRAPTNSPRLSPEPTGGLDTIREAQHESCNNSTQPLSRGERSVRFSKEVPEVPAPPSSPDREIEGPRSSVTTPMDQPETPKPTSTLPSNKSTDESSDNDRNEQLPTRPRGIKEPSVVSTPEPWPSVNEADYDMTPSGTNQGLHETQNSVNMDSRMADASSRNYTTTGTARSDISSATSSRNISGKVDSPGPPPPSPESRDRKRENTSGRRRELISRESSMAQIVEEKDEEHEDIHVKTLVVEVPPLGQPPSDNTKPHRSTDTFINIDIPAMGEDRSTSNSKMSEIVERPGTEESETHAQTINTRDALLSVQSTDGDGMSQDPDSTSNMDSAGVTPSLGANESPTSTIPENKLKMDDMKFMDQDGDKKDDHEVREDGGGQEITDEGGHEITEDGGDHEGFKQELEKELDRLS